MVRPVVLFEPRICRNNKIGVVQYTAIDKTWNSLEFMREIEIRQTRFDRPQVKDEETY